MSKVINGHLWMEEIGAGAWGKVRKVKRLEDDKIVAVKIMYTSKIKRKIKNGLQRLRNEFSLVQQLSHPSIIKYFLLDEESKPNYKIYLFMELCPNSIDPKQYIGGNWSRLLSFTKKVIEVLYYLHVEKGIAHHDIKPQNIVINSETGEIKLIDFNLASPDILNSQCFWGTPSYQSPEQLRSDTITFNGSKSDIWSLGIMLWELLSDHLPYRPSQIDPFSNMHPEAQIFSVMKSISEDPVPPLNVENIQRKFGYHIDYSLLINVIMQDILVRDPLHRIEIKELFNWSLCILEEF